MNAIYDPFEIEFSRREAVNSTTALNTDDKIFKIDTIEIPEDQLHSGQVKLEAVKTEETGEQAAYLAFVDQLTK